MLTSNRCRSKVFRCISTVDNKRRSYPVDCLGTRSQTTRLVVAWSEVEKSARRELRNFLAPVGDPALYLGLPCLSI